MNLKFLTSIIVLALVASPTIADGKNGKGNNKPLPPGLEKRAQQGKPLPPGWQKKLAKGDILGDDIYLRGSVVVPLGTDGILSISVEGTIIKLHEKTRKIIDILH